jgi:hypothetical protein
MAALQVDYDGGIGPFVRNGVKNEPRCRAFEAARGALYAAVPNVVWDQERFECFCIICLVRRGRGNIHKPALDQRGGRPYALPTAWAKFTLPLLDSQKSLLDKWVTAYHGTTIETLKKILYPSNKVHPELLFPGDTLANGHKLSVREGHIGKGFHRYNPYSKKHELFDPTNKIFLSPSIRYAELPGYSSKDGERVELGEGLHASIQVALLVRIEPDTFDIGPQTVKPDDEERICSDFPNSELEYYTDRRQTTLVVAVLVRLPDIDAFDISPFKGELRPPAPTPAPTPVPPFKVEIFI